MSLVGPEAPDEQNFSLGVAIIRGVVRNDIPFFFWTDIDEIFVIIDAFISQCEPLAIKF